MPPFVRHWCLQRAVFVLCTLVASGGMARAQIGSERYSSLVVEVQTGNVLSAANMDSRRYPASLTKMMTMYMLFEALRDRRVSLNQYVPISAEAASMPPTKLGLTPGGLMTVEQAILGLVTKSANDAAAAVGEMLGGDEDRFAQMMTVRARALGMTGTQFRNASGLPDEMQFTTARDMAILARHLITDFPSYYHYFSTPGFTFNGRYIPSHQHMLETYAGADGLKTGYIRDSGYNVVTSAVHGDTRLIGVVLGASNGWERDQHMTALLDAGFDRLGVPPLYVARRDDARVGFVSAARAAPPPVYAARDYAARDYAARAAPPVAYASPAPVAAARPYLRAVPAARGGRRAVEPRVEREMPTPPALASRAPQARVREAAQVQVLRPQAPVPAPRPAGQLYARRYGG